MALSRRPPSDLVKCRQRRAAELRMIDGVRHPDDLPVVGLVDLGLDGGKQRLIRLRVEEGLARSVEQRDTAFW